MTARGTLDLAEIRWGFGARVLGGPLSLRLGSGEALAVVGANGVGKSTLLRTIAGLHPALGGIVSLDGGALSDRKGAMARAKRVAFLDQGSVVDPELTVLELVELGRTAHLGLFGHLGAADREAVQEAIAACDLDVLASRRVGRLSGGERQRARLALALAQGAPLLLLDEPTTHLDLRRRQEIFELLKRLRSDRALIVVMVLHELAEAYTEADRVLVLSAAGAEEIAADDPTRRDRLAAAFEVSPERIILGGS